MTFEFNYDPEAEEINIVYDNYIYMKADTDNGKIRYFNFGKIEDEEVEKLLKDLCKQTFNIWT
jgi:hypothetical protein